MIQGKKSVLIALISLSLFVAIYEAVLFIIYSFEPSDYFSTFYSLVYLILVVMWVDIDSREQENIYRPYEYGFLVFIFYLPYLPYYFIKTRGIKGFFLFLGLVALLNLGYLLQWVYYFVT